MPSLPSLLKTTLIQAHLDQFTPYAYQEASKWESFFSTSSFKSSVSLIKCYDSELKDHRVHEEFYGGLYK